MLLTMEMIMVPARTRRSMRMMMAPRMEANQVIMRLTGAVFEFTATNVMSALSISEDRKWRKRTWG